MKQLGELGNPYITRKDVQCIHRTHDSFHRTQGPGKFDRRSFVMEFTLQSETQ